MPYYLDKVPEASEADLQQVQRDYRLYMETEDEEAFERVREQVQKRPAILKALFPDARQRALSKIDVDRLMAVAKSRGETLAVASELRTAICRKQGEAILQATGLQLQTQVAKFATSRLDEISDTIGESRIQFNEKYERWVAEAERHRGVPELYNANKQGLSRHLSVYFETLDTLLDGFIASLKSRLKDGGDSKPAGGKTR